MNTGTLKKVTAGFCAATLALTVFAPLGQPLQAQAKTVTTKATNMQKAKKVKKGTTTVKVKKYSSYTKFKAPKTKTYKFTFSSIKALKKGTRKIFGGFVTCYKGSPTSHKSLKFKTAGGKTYTLYLCTKAYRDVNTRYGSSTVSAYTPLPKRTAKVKLKKGTTVYFQNCFSPSGGVSYKLKIK